MSMGGKKERMKKIEKCKEKIKRKQIDFAKSQSSRADL